MIVILVMGILILQRLSKRVERRASSTSPPPEGRTQPGPAGDSGDLHDNNGGTQPGPTSSSGDLLDRDDWTTKYWVIHDRDVNSTSSCSQTHNEVIQLRRKNYEISKPLSVDKQPNVHGRARTTKRHLSESPVDTTSSLSLLGATSHVKGDGLRSKSAHDIRGITISPEVKELIKKTDSIIFIEQNCDLSRVSATYLSPTADTCHHHTSE
ncbi:uncharacterized protein LOC124153046 [Haliotis rufescens]|uniref:uncharacterized protein LOC124153046 n=1 Tax=Haliotis rufescens TaxID=6454 RepID=UPI00201E8946|nr:uncharacterized protein LOC124153046 [Haliotis rufescens]